METGQGSENNLQKGTSFHIAGKKRKKTERGEVEKGDWERETGMKTCLTGGACVEEKKRGENKKKKTIRYQGNGKTSLRILSDQSSDAGRPAEKKSWKKKNPGELATDGGV